MRGKGRFCNLLICWQKDHPRLCGEKSLRRSRLVNELGSPPPMRGKDLIADMDDPRYRITPAYAGKRE